MFAFWANKFFVFKSTQTNFVTIFREIIAFYEARLLSGAIEVFLPHLLILFGADKTLFGIECFYAKLVGSIFVIVFNYLVSEKIFSKSKHPKCVKEATFDGS